jgi:hypothetical protein
VVEEPQRVLGTFARATRDALESVVAPSVAATILAQALAASGADAVPEEVMPFRVFVESALRDELARRLGPATVALVLERLGNVLWMATSDVRALNVARSWSGRGGPAKHESGSRPRPNTRSRESDQPQPDASSAKRPTIPVPPSTPPDGKPPSGRPGSSPPSVPEASALPRPPRMPGAPRTEPTSGVSLRVPRAAVTVTSMPRATSMHPMPTGVLVVTLDPALLERATAELAGRCPVVLISAPVDLARAATRAGDRVVVIVDTTLPSIELATFVGLAPILPPETRVVLWGADERQHARLVSRFPVARSWVPSGESSTPGTFASSLG